MNVEITKPDFNDIEKIIPLWEQQCRYHHNVDSYYYADASKATNAEFRELVNKAIKKNEPNILIAKQADDIIGFITFSIEESNYADTNLKSYGLIKELIIDENFRRSGTGTLLMQAVEKFFAEQNIKDVCVFSAAANTSTVDFYEKLGYKIKRIAMFKKIK